MMFAKTIFTKTNHVRVEIPKAALEVIFNECDRYDADETGGRILGTCESLGNKFHINVSGVIEPGPSAKRTATYFKQDGAWQEEVFRKVEEREPTIEHLGNWHTHHVNGLRHLSEGDIETYRRTVEHANHNTDIFYALLVTEKKARKEGLDRYLVKHYILRRGDPAVYEIPDTDVKVIGAPLVWPISVGDEGGRIERDHAPMPSQEGLRHSRVMDRDILAEFYPSVASFMSKQLGVYWRGPVTLVDGSQVEVIVLENSASAKPEYTMNIRTPAAELEKVAKKFGDATYSSCRAALIAMERACNAALFKGKR